MAAKPLEGIRVLDFSQYLPGPLCAQHLADLGADVLKIENPKGGDPARPTPTGESASRNFLLVNRNKRSLSVNLREAEGVEIVRQLTGRADVVIDGFRPGVMERLGLGYAALREVNPRLVFCAITGYGQDGPYAMRGGHDINYQSLAGILEQSGASGGPPTPGNFQIADLAGGTLTAVMGILAALYDVQRSGRGRFVDVSMTDAVLAHSIAAMVALQSYGHGRPLPRGEDFTSGRLACYGVYETADGRHLALGALEPQFWQAFCRAAERPDLIAKGFVLDDTSAQARAEVAALVSSRTLQDWTTLLEGVDACATPVLRLDEVMLHPQTRARGMVVAGESADGVAYPQFAFPLKMSEYRFTVDRRPPKLGEHNREILTDLGYDEACIADFEARKII